MTTIVDFLTARLDEDEAVARAAGAAGGASSWHTLPHPMYEGRVEDENGLTVVYNEGAPTGDEAAHIARHDPARVLREVAAKRAIIKQAEVATGHSGSVADEWGSIDVPEPGDLILRHLAAIYADAPGCDENWRI